MKVLLVSLVLLGTAVAQSEDSGFEVFAGYSHVNSNVGLNGWNFAGTYRPESAAWLGLVGDISGTYGSDVVLGRMLPCRSYSLLCCCPPFQHGPGFRRGTNSNDRNGQGS